MGAKIVKAIDVKDKDKNLKGWFLSVYFPLIAMAFFILILILVITVSDFKDRPEFVLPVICIAGVACLMSLLTMVAAILYQLGLTDEKQALGLPDGSVRAMIALNLIILFVIMSVFLYSDLAKGDKIVKLDGITQAQLNAIPSDQIISSNKQDDKFDVVLKDGKLVGISEDISNNIPKEQIVSSNKQDDKFDVQLVDGKLVGISQELLNKIPPDQIASSNKQDNRFDVERRVAKSQAAEDIAKQTVTTAGVLITAVSGFYFGARTAESAQGKPESQNGDKSKGKPSLSIINPKPDPEKPYTLEKGKDKELIIVIETKPDGMAVDGESITSGDSNIKLQKVQPNVFKYESSHQPAGDITLRFWLVDHPETTATLKVKIIEETKTKHIKET